MSILQKLHSRDPQKGYATDFVKHASTGVLPDLLEKRRARRRQRRRREPPRVQRRAARGPRASTPLTDRAKVAVLEGDDILGADRRAAWPPVRSSRNMDTGAPLVDRARPGHQRQRLPRRLPPRRGARPPAPDIVDHRPRVPIPGLVLAPLIHEFGWKSGRLGPPGRGHRGRPHPGVRSRSAPAATTPTGATSPTSRWSAIRSPRGGADGSFTVTKHEGTGRHGHRAHRAPPAGATRWATRSELHHARRGRRLHELEPAPTEATTAYA